MKVKSIEYSGGVCPYQAEGTLEDERFFYLRYRGGRLALYVDKNKGRLPDKDNLVFEDKYGDQYDGGANNEVFHKKLDSIIEFPEGFVFQYEG